MRAAEPTAEALAIVEGAGPLVGPEDAAFWAAVAQLAGSLSGDDTDSSHLGHQAAAVDPGAAALVGRVERVLRPAVLGEPVTPKHVRSFEWVLRTARAHIAEGRYAREVARQAITSAAVRAGYRPEPAAELIDAQLGPKS